MAKEGSPKSSPVDFQETPPHAPSHKTPKTKLTQYWRRVAKADPYLQQSTTPVKKKQDQPVSDQTSHHSSSLDSGKPPFNPPKISYADILRRRLAPPQPPPPVIKKEDQPLTKETSHDSSLVEDHPEQETPPEPEEENPTKPYDEGDGDSTKPQDENASSIEESIAYPRDTESYHLLSKISEGTRCLILKALCVPLNTFVAIKMILLVDTDTQPDVDAIEAAIDSLPSHPNILKPYCTFIDNCELWVVMPYIAGGSLISTIDHGGELPLKCIAMVLETVLNVLVSIHGQGISHQGIKPGNILLDFDGKILLSDFRISSSNWIRDVLLARPEGSDSASPPYWVPPEAIASESRFTPKSDIWSLGITAMELFYGSPPIAFDTRIPKFMILKFAKRYQYTSNFASGKGKNNRTPSNSFRNFVESCLEVDYVKRPDPKKLLKHPLFSLCKGKGSSYLTSNVMVASLPSVDRRSQAKSTDGSLFSTECICMRQLVGWVLYSDKFELKPIYLATSAVQKKQDFEMSYNKLLQAVNAEELDKSTVVEAVLAVGSLIDEQVEEFDRLQSLDPDYEVSDEE